MKKRTIIHPWEVFNGIDEVAEAIGKSTSTVRRMMDQGLEFRRMGHNVFITGNQILNYINQNNVIYSTEIVDKVEKVSNLRRIG